MSKISIIVPVYNVEAYLEKCLDSLINQTYQNFEILLIDDASSDRSGQICKEYAQRDNRIRYIKKSYNSGQGDARNLGLENATGDYITFVDSDDWINLDCIEKLFHNLIENDADIVMCHFYRFSESSGGYLLYTPDFQSGLIGLTDFFEAAFKGLSLYIAPWGKLFKRELLEFPTPIRFPRGKIAEDIDVLHRIYLRSHKIYFESEALYCWLERSNSTSTTFFYEKKGKDYLTGLERRFLDMTISGKYASNALENYLFNLRDVKQSLEETGLTETDTYRGIQQKLYLFEHRE